MILPNNKPFYDANEATIHKRTHYGLGLFSMMNKLWITEVLPLATTMPWRTRRKIEAFSREESHMLTVYRHFHSITAL